MSNSVKYFAVVLLVYSGFVSACIVGPAQLTADASYGFVFKSESSDLCNKCNMITITAPMQYKKEPFSHGLVTIYSGQEIVSRSIHSSINESGLPEFTGIVNAAKGIGYEVTFEYGKGRCMSYKFKYGNIKNGS